jgi:hypothetical protein
VVAIVVAISPLEVVDSILEEVIVLGQEDKVDKQVAIATYLEEEDNSLVVEDMCQVVEVDRNTLEGVAVTIDLTE